MDLTPGLVAALGAPMLCAGGVLAFPVAPARRVLPAAGLLACAGALISELVIALREGPVIAGSFATDPWRLALALGAVVVALPEVLARTSAERFASSWPAEEAAKLGAIASAIGMVLAADAVSASAFLLAATACAGVSASGDGGGPRVVLRYALSDVAAIAGLLVAARGGMVLPLLEPGAATLLLAAAAAARLGFAPSLAWFERSATGAAGAVVIGAMRVQGLALAAWVLRGPASARDAVLVLTAALAAWAATRAARDASAPAALAAHGALVLAAAAFGGEQGAHAVVVLSEATLVAAVALGARVPGMLAPLVGAAPLGLGFVGAAVLGTAVLDRAAGEPAAALAAFPLAVAIVRLAQAGAAGFHTIGARAAPALALALGGVSVAVAALQSEVLRVVSDHAAGALGVGELIGGARTSASTQLGIVLLSAAIVAALVAPRARPLGPAPAAPDASAHAVYVPDVPARWTAAAAVAALAGGWFLALLWVGIGRGFL